MATETAAKRHQLEGKYVVFELSADDVVGSALSLFKIEEGFLESEGHPTEYTPTPNILGGKDNEFLIEYLREIGVKEIYTLSFMPPSKVFLDQTLDYEDPEDKSWYIHKCLDHSWDSYFKSRGIKLKRFKPPLSRN